MKDDQNNNKHWLQLGRLALQLEEAIEMATEAAKPVALDQTLQGRVSRGDAIQQQAMANANLTSNRARLKRVKSALVKITNGEFGECEVCGELISEGRLKIMPETPYFLTCQDRQEQI